MHEPWRGMWQETLAEVYMYANIPVCAHTVKNVTRPCYERGLTIENGLLGNSLDETNSWLNRMNHWMKIKSHQNISQQLKAALNNCKSLWRHQMETFSALLAICAGNSPVTGEFPTQRPVTRSFDVYFDLCPNERLSKQSWGWWFETLSRSLWRHRNDSSGREWATHKYVSLNQDIFGSDNGLLYPVRHEAIVWTNVDLCYQDRPKHTCKWNSNWKSNISIHENEFENIGRKLVTILSRPHRVNSLWPSNALWRHSIQ